VQFILSELNPESDLVLGKYVLGYSAQPESMCVLMIIYCSKLGTGPCLGFNLTELPNPSLLACG
jgi:hypothetical protein